MCMTFLVSELQRGHRGLQGDRHAEGTQDPLPAQEQNRVSRDIKNRDF